MSGMSNIKEKTVDAIYDVGYFFRDHGHILAIPTFVIGYVGLLFATSKPNPNAPILTGTHFSPTQIQGKNYVVATDSYASNSPKSNIALMIVDTTDGKVSYIPVEWNQIRDRDDHENIMDAIKRHRQNNAIPPDNIESRLDSSK